ncbi:MAG TPA: DNA mismatch repair endonuclease MutL, partial [Taishania sp.]|nr:DNA mismatch repair endonuclease MutL [Taishania sp.]
MKGIISVLPDHIANQIAAGEVIQRPASVVKELVENALDAGATRIVVNIKDAGRTLIQITDDGKGMNATDAELCFLRHATSKIHTAADLFNLSTKGFRGEALASIAAIAHVTLQTKEENADTGTLIQIEGNKIISKEEVVCNKGTNFEVKNLFYNVPARRNFLKSNDVEFRHIRDEFERIVLAHPNVNFVLIHNDTEVYNLRSAVLRKRIVDVIGDKQNERLVPIFEETSIAKITGFVIKPEYAKKTRGEQFFFVNNRFFKDAYFNNAVSKAFDNL